MFQINNRKVNKAFTLIEILIVVAIVGVLSGIVMVSVSDSQESARIAKIEAFSDSVRNSMITSLVSEWKFDENTGTTTVDSWGSSDGTLVNGPVWKTGADCVSGSCLQFSASSDYVNGGSGAVFDFTDKVTIEAWAYETNRGSARKVVSRRSSTQYLFLGLNNGVPYGGVTGGYYSSSSAVSANQWHHLVLVFSDSDDHIWLYQDGIAVIDREDVAPMPDLSGINVSIGADYQGTSNFFVGLIDEVRIYNDKLSISQIKENYLAGLDSLLAKQAITQQEYDQRLTEFNSNYAQN